MELQSVTTPTNLTRDGTLNFTGIFNGNQELICSGSVDNNNDELTYYIEYLNSTVSSPTTTSQIYYEG